MPLQFLVPLKINIPLNELKSTVTKFALHISFDYFNLNYKEPFDINIFDCSFDYKKGYTIIRKENIEVLIYRFENLPEIFPFAIEVYFGISGIELPRVNISSQKKYANTYEATKNNFYLEKNILDKIYSSEVVKKFYSDHEIDGFYKKWEKKNSKN